MTNSGASGETVTTTYDGPPHCTALREPDGEALAGVTSTLLSHTGLFEIGLNAQR